MKLNFSIDLNQLHTDCQAAIKSTTHPNKINLTREGTLSPNSKQQIKKIAGLGSPSGTYNPGAGAPKGHLVYQFDARQLLAWLCYSNETEEWRELRDATKRPINLASMNEEEKKVLLRTFQERLGIAPFLDEEE